MKKLLLLIVLGFSFLATGCAVQVRGYEPVESNTQQLKSLGVQLNVNKFTAKKSESRIMCRLANKVETPVGEYFETYIENALIAELKKAGMYSKESPVTIDGYLVDTDASSGMSDGHWTFNLDISSGDKKGFNVIHKRDYSGSFMGGIACKRDMPEAFRPTVQELIGKIINHPEFRTLVGG